MTEEQKTKKPRGPAKTLAEKLADERAKANNRVARAERRANAANQAAGDAEDELVAARAELAQIDAMLAARGESGSVAVRSAADVAAIRSGEGSLLKAASRLGDE